MQMQLPRIRSDTSITKTMREWRLNLKWSIDLRSHTVATLRWLYPVLLPHISRSLLWWKLWGPQPNQWPLLCPHYPNNLITECGRIWSSAQWIKVKMWSVGSMHYPRSVNKRWLTPIAHSTQTYSNSKRRHVWDKPTLIHSISPSNRLVLIQIVGDLLWLHEMAVHRGLIPSWARHRMRL